MVFNPALGNGRPIGVWIKLKIKFDVNRENTIAQRFVHEINNLYKKTSVTLPSEKEHIQTLILAKDSEFVKNMTDALNFNRTIKKVLLPETVSDWEKYWDTYPLTFLLYYDFMHRFPDFRERKSVETQMLNALRYDIHFIENTPELENSNKGAKERLLQKLQELTRNNSPNSNQNNPADLS